MNDILHNPRLGRIGSGAKNTLGGFKAFLLRGNVVDLAVGIVIGAAFTSVVNAFVSDFITPLIGGFTNVSFFDWAIHLPPSGKNQIAIGHFLNAVISFIIVAAVVYFLVVLPVNKLMTMQKKGVPDGAASRDCPYCLSNIPDKATRCPYCTSVVDPVEPAQPQPSPAVQQPQG